MGRERDPDRAELERLLAQHYGDGQVYFTSPADLRLFQVARERGLVSDTGLLTATGRQWISTIAATVH